MNEWTNEYRSQIVICSNPNQDQLKECFVQNVTQCYFTYVTEYSDGIQEKCVDFYWKTCKIAFKERVFNATTRNCKRPLIKKCDDAIPAQDSYGVSGGNEQKIVCETFFETECNTTHVVPAPTDEPLQVISLITQVCGSKPFES